MTDVGTRDTCCSPSVLEVPVPPRPQWLPNPRPATPLRPTSHPNTSTPPASRSLTGPLTLIDTEESSTERPRDWRQDATAFLVSLAVHLMIALVVWQMFRFVMRPSSTGFVITSEIDTGLNTAESDKLTMIDSPVPQVQTVAMPHATAVEIVPVHIGSGAPSGVQATIGGGGGGGGGIGFFGARAEAKSFVFVVDKSGSMANALRLETAKLELAGALRALEPDQEFYVIFYDDQMLRMLAPHAPPRLQRATRRNVSLFLDWVGSHVQPGGGTVPLESLLTALELQPEVIFFLTDGDIDPATAAMVHLRNTHDTVIHTLCFSNDYGEQVMRQIADENRGRYRFVDDQTAIAQQQERERLERTAQQEQAARAKLQNARRHLELGRTATGISLLRKLIDEFPDTAPAREAEPLLQTLNAAE